MESSCCQQIQFFTPRKRIEFTCLEPVFIPSRSDVNGDVVPYASPLLDNTVFTCHGLVDPSGERFILSDTEGRLLMLILNIGEGRSGITVKDMRIEYLGETSIADSINYIDAGVVFVGSRLGDSQLIRLMPTPSGGSYSVVSI